jgi:plasmid stabilization system protein ParE
MPETYRVIYTSNSSDDLEEIFDYISQTSSQNAVEVINRLVKEIDGLDILPQRFAPTRSRRKFHREIRTMAVPPFLVYYEIKEATRTVAIVAIERGTRRS